MLKRYKLILMEAAVVERIRRSETVLLHQKLANGPLIYDKQGRRVLKEIYQGYINIARQSDLPFLMCSPTWRANRERISSSGIAPSLNGDAVRFMLDLRDEQANGKATIKVGGMTGCKNDCYNPDEALSAAEAETFHSWQIDQLVDAGVDFLVAVTLPAVEEAVGIARAMALTGHPYIISFVISCDGRVLDTTSLELAISRIDAEAGRKPLGFMINCAYPTFLCAAKQPAAVLSRLIGFQANASSLDHTDLDGAETIQVDDKVQWAHEMMQLNNAYGIKILGGCCGTADGHLRRISDAWRFSTAGKTRQ